MDLEELERLAALGGGHPSDSHGMHEETVSLDRLAELGEPAADQAQPMEDDDLEILANLGRRRPVFQPTPKPLARRSSELMAHARLAKERLRSQNAVAKAKARATAAGEGLHQVAENFPLVVIACGAQGQAIAGRNAFRGTRRLRGKCVDRGSSEGSRSGFVPSATDHCRPRRQARAIDLFRVGPRRPVEAGGRCRVLEEVCCVPLFVERGGGEPCDGGHRL